MCASPRDENPVENAIANHRKSQYDSMDIWHIIIIGNMWLGLQRGSGFTMNYYGFVVEAGDVNYCLWLSTQLHTSNADYK